MPCSVATFSLPIPAADELLHDLLAVSLTGINFLRPLYSPAGELNDFLLEYLNPVAQQLTGLPEQPGSTTGHWFPATYTNGLFTFYRRVFETGEAGRYDVSYQVDGLDNYFQVAARRSGERLVVSFTDTRNHDRTPVELALRATQASEQAARAEAERQWAELSNFLEQAPVAIALFEGADYLVTLANQAHLDLWDRTAAQMLGQPLFEALPEARHVGYEELLAGVLRTGQPYVAHEATVQLTRYGRRAPVYFDFVYHPWRDISGLVRGVLVVATDITAQVAARQQVQTLNEELTASNEELQATNTSLHVTNAQLKRTNTDLDNFIYTASHDLKTPITNIEGLLQALAYELPTAGRVGDVPRMLDLMQESVERFKRTIGCLTDVARLRQEHEPTGEAVLLAAVVEQVRLDLAALLTETRGQLYVAIPASLRVLLSEKNLRSVVYNLLNNALRYCHPERTPQVYIGAWLQDEHCILAVQDNGLGLDLPRVRPRLFSMFQRLHSHVAGTGLGLYTVKRLLENAGGHIEVRSQLGQGSTFTAYLPQ